MGSSAASLGNARERLVRRAARDIVPGSVVNLGIGLPSKVAEFLPADFPVCLHTENGLTGLGPAVPLEEADRNLIDAGGAYVGTVAGAAFFDSVTSFSLVRSGRLDLSILGAFEVAANGDLANWKIPGKFSPGPGGAIELAQKAKRVCIVTTHTDRHGNPKLLRQCTLPRTGTACVARVYTDLAVIDVTPAGFLLRERAEGRTVEEIRAATGAPLQVAKGPLPVF